jgi:signal transduction histidine kinase
VEGTPYVYPDALEEQIVRVGAEAIGNSVRHSGGSRIQAKLVYHHRSLQLEIADNGRGVEDSVLQSDSPGHFGIRGMQERAEAAGAKLSITSEAGRGTVVALVVPLPRTKLVQNFLFGRRRAPTRKASQA